MEFSVIIPTFGRPDLLVQTIESVLQQTLAAHELIVVLDGDDARTEQALRDLPVRMLSQRRAGPATARNAGAAAASGQWLCFLDDDDLWIPERLEITAAFLREHPSCLAAHAGFSWLHPDGNVTEPDIAYINLNERSYDLLLENNRGVISTSTVRRDVFKKSGGFPDGYTCAEDWVMFLNVARVADWYTIPGRLSLVRRHPGRNTVSNPTNGLVTLRAIGAVWSDPRPTPPHRPLSVYGPQYRAHARAAIYAALHRGALGLAYRCILESWHILPRVSDRILALMPPQVTHRMSALRRSGLRTCLPGRSRTSRRG